MVAFPARLERPRRAHNLWQQTCMEAFLKTEASEGYFEFNFSPSRAWAGYYFNNYRGTASAALIAAPRFNRESSSREWSCVIEAEMPKSIAGVAWRLNLSAVIEETAGTKSYWALAHPASGPPDFHDPACFVLELPPATAP